MIAFLKKYKLFLLTLVIFAIVFLTISYKLLSKNKGLPIINPSEVNPELVDTTIQYKSKYHTIANFSFTNQNGKTITQNDYEGKIYVADFFFTTCKTICPKMTGNMEKVQKAIINYPKVKLLSFSVQPEYDTPAVLKKYAQEKGVLDEKWNLVTGNKREIYYLARKSYLAVKTGSPNELYDMVHTENFVLIDSKKRIRGFYDGTSESDIEKLITDINWLCENEK
jgi:protein SCO1